MCCGSWGCKELDTTERLNWTELNFSGSYVILFLQHQTLPSPPDTSTVGCYFCFGSASSFLLELFLSCSPVAHWTPTAGGFIFHCLVFLPLLTIVVAQRVKRLLVMREAWVRSLGREDPLEKEMATHFSTLAWKIPWTEKPCRLQSMGSQRVGHDWVTSLYLYYSGYTYWLWFSQEKRWLFWRHVASNKSRIKKDSIGIIYMEVIFEAQKRRSKRKFRRTCIIAA